MRQRRSRQPAVRTATRVCGVLRLTLIIGPRMYFGAILCKKARQPRVYKAFGGRRHTFATLALQNGVDVKTVSSMLGHYDAGFTLRTYTHATRQKQDEAAQTMGSFMAQVM